MVHGVVVFSWWWVFVGSFKVWWCLIFYDVVVAMEFNISREKIRPLVVLLLWLMMLLWL